MSKEYRNLEKIVNAYRDYTKLLDTISFNREVLNGDDRTRKWRELAKVELPQLETEKTEIESAIRQLLIPKDPQDRQECNFEIRAGTGAMKLAFCGRPDAYVYPLL